MRPNLINTWLQPGVVGGARMQAVSTAWPAATRKPLKRLADRANDHTGLKPGANESRTPRTLLTLAALIILIAGCAKKEDAAKPEEHKSAEPESRVKRGTNGEVVITLDAATQKVMGLQVSPLAAASLSPEVKGYGRVLDPTALSIAVTELASARVAAEASQKELARVQTLAGQDNASRRALEAAQAAAQRDMLQAASAQVRLLASMGKGIAVRDDLPEFAQRLASGESALVRVELPAGEMLKSEPASARLVPVAGDNQPIEAKFVGAAAVMDPQTQGQGFLFLVESNQSRLVSGVAVTAFIKLTGDSQSGVSVPRNAILRFNGATWIYLQTGDQTFQRTEVSLDRPVSDGWFVREGLKPQDKVVTVGAQQLLSEELKGQGSGG